MKRGLKDVIGSSVRVSAVREKSTQDLEVVLMSSDVQEGQSFAIDRRNIWKCSYSAVTDKLCVGTFLEECDNVGRFVF